MTELSATIASFAGKRVLVVGDAMLDAYWEGTCVRICPEAPAPVIDLIEGGSDPGGAANVAANVQALGAEAMLVGILGDDDEAAALRTALHDRGVATNHLLHQRGRKTLAKRRVTVGGQVVCRIDQGDTGAIDEEAEARLVNRLAEMWEDADAAILSDYGYGTLTPNVIAAIAALQARSPRIVAVDSKRLGAFRSVRPTVVKPNYWEAVRLLDLPPDNSRARADTLVAHGPQLLELAGARIASATLDRDGAVVFERGRAAYRTYAESTARCFPCGAGDTYLAAFTMALTSGAETPAAAELAAAAAAVVVARPGTSPCAAIELHARLHGRTKIVDRPGVAIRLAEERKLGRRIVLTNGCFDILHRGHVTYLARAKSLGDVLVVGVNTDDGIRRLKGPERPINALDDRLDVLAALSSVDYLVPFDEPTPHEIIRVVRPEVFVKGGDYTRDRLPEADLVEQLGGEIRILSFLADRSTTGLIERIRTREAQESLR
ncbi:MAG TPA: D-glycero-beta-D-manno-heptose 1-phosphate adenylyltransferase [Urbifossiella sp.]|nr:D-glycero-beta-D-manno-heptose 1-phosphate adenylyltransferase [Urbifossiella sp.]